MKTSQIVLLGVVAALMVLAAVLWGTRPSPQPVHAPAPAGEEAPLPNAGTSDQAPVAPPSPTTASAALPAQMVAMPQQATNGELPPFAQPRKLEGLVQTPEQIEKALNVATDLAGGDAALRPLLSARWKLMLSSVTRTLFLEMLTDAKGALRVRDEQTGVERFLEGPLCRTVRDGVVEACTHPDERLMRALQMGERASLPLRLLKEPKLQVMDAPDLLFFKLPGADEEAQTVLMMNRDSAAIEAAGFTKTRLYLQGRAAVGAVTLPLVWALDPGTDEADDVGKNKGKKSPTTAKEILAGGNKAAISIRVQSVDAMKEKNAIKMPALTESQPMKVVARPELHVMKREAGKHSNLGKVAEPLLGPLALEDKLDLSVMVAFAPAADSPRLDQKVELWVMLPNTPSVEMRFKDKWTTIAAEPAVAKKMLLVEWGDLPDQMAKFVSEVGAAGYEFAPGPTVARLLGDTFGPGTPVELQVPVKPK